jgi:uncharacterized protein
VPTQRTECRAGVHQTTGGSDETVVGVMGATNQDQAQKGERGKATDLRPTERERDIASRVDDRDWDGIRSDLNDYGAASIGELLSPRECSELTALYGDKNRFRSRIVMGRHGFGRGEYQYFAYPLPETVAELRTALYTRLAEIANAWSERMRAAERYAPTLDGFLRRCHEAGQAKPTPLLLKYGAGDFNALHQDLYGEIAFPIQVVILLSEPGRDFTGGEFVLTEQRPRMQSRAEVVSLSQGEAVAFAVHNRPVDGAKGTYRVNMRHGVSRMRSGQRHTLGVIFHDAK